MYKFELAVYAGITSKTFRRWTKPFDEELARPDAPRQKRTGGLANVVPLQSQLRNCNHYSIHILNF